MNKVVNLLFLLCVIIFSCVCGDAFTLNEANRARTGVSGVKYTVQKILKYSCVKTDFSISDLAITSDGQKFAVGLNDHRIYQLMDKFFVKLSLRKKVSKITATKGGVIWFLPLYGSGLYRYNTITKNLRRWYIHALDISANDNGLLAIIPRRPYYENSLYSIESITKNGKPSFRGLYRPEYHGEHEVSIFDYRTGKEKTINNLAGHTVDYKCKDPIVLSEFKLNTFYKSDAKIIEGSFPYNAKPYFNISCSDSGLFSYLSYFNTVVLWDSQSQKYFSSNIVASKQILGKQGMIYTIGQDNNMRTCTPEELTAN